MTESAPAPIEGFFQAGGTLKADSPGYIERRADRELYECARDGAYAYVLTSRQMGKSSLMTRIAARLRREGVKVAVLDLTGIGGDAGSMLADKWYFGLANAMLRELELAFALAAWWKEHALLPPLNRLMNFFQDVVLAHLDGNIVVFIDEIDTTIKLPFSDDFFAAIRACFNARANHPVFDRISFVLLGVASPADLIRDPTRTPFNIGKRIDLSDFSMNEARHFVRGLQNGDGTAERLLERVLHWTNGHPYLTQKLCALVSTEKILGESPKARVDRHVKAEFLGMGRRAKEDNLKVIDDRITKAGELRPELLKLYAKVRKGRRIQDQPQSPVYSALKLSGLVKADAEGRLIVRNEIYRQVFDARWIKRLMPGRWKQRAEIAMSVFLIMSGSVFGWWIGAQQLTVESGKGIILAWLGMAYPEPEMIDIPAGHFMMGSPEDEPGRTEKEGPQHEVHISRFKLGKFEITFDQYDVFAFLIDFDSDCDHKVDRAKDQDWGRGNRPVINVSWQDAQCFANWLSKHTGKRYRLPSEAEWEYAARAGTQTARPWPDGEDAACYYANVLDQRHERDVKDLIWTQYKSFGLEESTLANLKRQLEELKPFNCDDKFAFTAPVGGFSANLFGLNDMLGNVLEWTADCWHENYQNAPVNGSAWEQQNDGYCGRRVIRGGSWGDGPGALRAALRYRDTPGYRFPTLGFRLAQD
ncbi:MAG: SUMF1/EgtB/PvdO family nonheme iron enzyme [Methylosarcina sp.]